jgi:hypothetical protein
MRRRRLSSGRRSTMRAPMAMAISLVSSEPFEGKSQAPASSFLPRIAGAFAVP